MKWKQKYVNLYQFKLAIAFQVQPTILSVTSLKIRVKGATVRLSTNHLAPGSVVWGGRAYFCPFVMECMASQNKNKANTGLECLDLTLEVMLECFIPPAAKLAMVIDIIMAYKG